MKSYEKMNKGLEKKKEIKRESDYLDELKKFAEELKREKQHDLDYMEEYDEMKPLSESINSQPVNKEYEEEKKIKEKFEALRGKSEEKSESKRTAKEIKDGLNRAMQDVLDSLKIENNQHQIERDDDEER